MIKINGSSFVELSVAYAISANGIDILKKEKYSKHIDKTVISKTKGGILKAIWLDKQNKTICETTMFDKEERIPKIGTVVYDEFQEF